MDGDTNAAETQQNAAEDRERACVGELEAETAQGRTEARKR